MWQAIRHALQLREGPDGEQGAVRSLRVWYVPWYLNDHTGISVLILDQA